MQAWDISTIRHWGPFHKEFLIRKRKCKEKRQSSGEWALESQFKVRRLLQIPDSDPADASRSLVTFRRLISQWMS